ncbi:class I SAM-dependent methyltransferase [Aliihoeflea aestuarii]|jgi:SAM-dependent methyltransferase|uniref:class I SAM-dependent methyltransferase n=1 Tax=Aliihoeflea aestuarii TaxID=453840 RepID=UPI002092E1F1|nr:class I SAM-dependent methyltransferase [Aliihoeflea aestuarii]MCO6391667.1 class I SAM-dependent methyltransferase [Aliihoeflea aestuarii]
MGVNLKHVALDGESLVTPESMAAELRQLRSERGQEGFEQARDRLALVLAIADQQFKSEGDPAAIIHRTAGELHLIRRSCSTEVWQKLIPIAQEHPVSDYFLEDPFTRWCFEMPRGYSGDAITQDFIYGHESLAAEIENASELGRKLYQYTSMAPSSVAGRERRDILAREVDAAAAARAEPIEVLTIASGHLREAAKSQALKDGTIKRWIALDQDPLSVGSVVRDYQGTVIEGIDGSVKGLLGNSYDLGQFDLVYASGLYDYLSRGVAARLTRKCMSLLKPGGSFLFANFSDEILVDGFMETFMNWALLLRSDEDMWDIVNRSVDRNSIDARVFYGENRNIVYAMITKKD